ncbi:MAG: hypothetical protein ABIQ02_05255 [Saprospiraceae bacterium]
METEINQDKDENRGKYWLITLASFAVGVTLLFVLPSFFWIALPFFFTYFVKAIGMM